MELEPRFTTCPVHGAPSTIMVTKESPVQVSSTIINTSFLGMCSLRTCVEAKHLHTSLMQKTVSCILARTIRESQELYFINLVKWPRERPICHHCLVRQGHSCIVLISPHIDLCVVWRPVWCSTPQSLWILAEGQEEMHPIPACHT